VDERSEGVYLLFFFISMSSFLFSLSWCPDTMMLRLTAGQRRLSFLFPLFLFFCVPPGSVLSFFFFSFAPPPSFLLNCTRLDTRPPAWVFLHFFLPPSHDSSLVLSTSGRKERGDTRLISSAPPSVRRRQVSFFSPARPPNRHGHCFFSFFAWPPESPPSWSLPFFFFFSPPAPGASKGKRWLSVIRDFFFLSFPYPDSVSRAGVFSFYFICRKDVNGPFSSLFLEKSSFSFSVTMGAERRQ